VVVSPAAVASASSTPSWCSAGPACVGAEREGANCRSELNTVVDWQRSGRPKTVIATLAPGRATRRASRSVCTMSSAMKNELKPVTMSNESSAQGRSAMSPTRKSPSGTRSRAISTSGPAASMPATLAPRSAAMRQKRPAPHPTSSTAVPSSAGTRSRTWR
jgi:hypothetical protein